MINLFAASTPELDLAMLTVTEQGLNTACRLMPSIDPARLSREDLLSLSATVHAAQRELETITLKLAPHLKATPLLNTSDSAKH